MSTWWILVNPPSIPLSVGSTFSQYFFDSCASGCKSFDGVDSVSVIFYIKYTEEGWRGLYFGECASTSGGRTAGPVGEGKEAASEREEKERKRVSSRWWS